MSDAVDVRAPHGRAGLDDCQAIGREHERRGRSPHSIESGGRGPVDPRAFSLARTECHFERHGAAVTGALRAHVEAVGAEADEVRVEPRPRREPLSRDVERLEEIRLACAVRAGGEDEPRLEVEVEIGVRAEVAKCEVRDDQSGSRMGMMRYRKPSSGPCNSPGRSGLIRRSWISSPPMDSMPSWR